MLSGFLYTIEPSPDPSSDQTTFTNTSIGVATRKHMFVSRDVGFAGFNDHVNSLAYYARPFTIERLERYRRTNFAFLVIVLNARL